ncbi:OmpA/MotB family protein [Paenibacillus sp. MAH-36]|uniref:OmpA family protein n=1 Tax=Paenibacillus violae TaxID=3077234 RepID=A0ABU3RPQ5_9BACL|nr:OmpA family protein [Paenibacillus sp. PFR10]MDU0205827.1 OmpA family protein [Paenibacillus sp. PFR10]
MRNAKREQVNWWMSYADLMSVMLMVFALILTVVVLDIQESTEQKEVAEQKAQQIQEQKAVAEQKAQQIQEQAKTKAKEIEQAIGLKTEIIKELTDYFRQSNMQIEIDQQTGAIRFPGSVLYDSGSYVVSEQGKAFLKSFIPKYMGILLQDRFKDKVASIMIEGHTDNSGTYMYNMELSQNRAFSVLKYIYSSEFPNFPQRDSSQNLVTCNGRSYSQPLFDSQGNIDQERSRRVEFLFRLKDEEAFQAIEKLVQDK